MRREAATFVLAASVLSACTAGTSTAASTPSPESRTPTASIVVHWMSWSSAAVPHWRLVYEGGENAPFSQLRLLGPDGSVVAAAPATPSASETFHVCAGGKRGQPASYGPLRVMLIVPTQQILHDIIGRPDAYRVQALANGLWLDAQTINECHMQE